MGLPISAPDKDTNPYSPYSSFGLQPLFSSYPQISSVNLKEMPLESSKQP